MQQRQLLCAVHWLHHPGLKKPNLVGFLHRAVHKESTALVESVASSQIKKKKVVIRPVYRNVIVLLYSHPPQRPEAVSPKSWESEDPYV